jgi:hypothetical protein
LQDKERLIKSHYIPSALYASPGKLEFATRESSGVVIEHMRVPLLCDECEGLFDSMGESEVLRHIAAKSSKYFPLHEKLRLALPREEWPDVARFSGQDIGVDMDKFAYFALSIVWRGAAHDWILFDGTVRPRTRIGGFEEPIRQYLLGKSPLPPDTAIIVIVCTDDGARKTFTTPVIHVEDNCLNFRFLARGVLFRVMMGRHLPEAFRQASCTSSRKCLWYGSAKHRMPEILAIFEEKQLQVPQNR